MLVKSTGVPLWEAVILSTIKDKRDKGKGKQRPCQVPLSFNKQILGGKQSGSDYFKMKKAFISDRNLVQNYKWWILRKKFKRFKSLRWRKNFDDSPSTCKFVSNQKFCRIYKSRPVNKFTAGVQRTCVSPNLQGLSLSQIIFFFSGIKNTWWYQTRHGLVSFWGMWKVQLWTDNRQWEILKICKHSEEYT